VLARTGLRVLSESNRHSFPSTGSAVGSCYSLVPYHERRVIDCGRGANHTSRILRVSLRNDFSNAPGTFGGGRSAHEYRTRDRPARSRLRRKTHACEEDDAMPHFRGEIHAREEDDDVHHMCDVCRSSRPLPPIWSRQCDLHASSSPQSKSSCAHIFALFDIFARPVILHDTIRSTTCLLKAAPTPSPRRVKGEHLLPAGVVLVVCL